ncbi:MAG: hypothetical protein NUV56_01490, partial [Candidatus Uhrbacteria bacterium]|nr:hypothetical protein [Candidatus Uhrbacteria bacterium]
MLKTIAFAAVVLAVGLGSRAVFAVPADEPQTLPWNKVVLNTEREILSLDEASALYNERVDSPNICQFMNDVTERTGYQGITDPAVLDEALVRQVFIDAYSDETLADQAIVMLKERLELNRSSDGSIDKDNVRFGFLQVCASHGTVLIGGLD